MKALTLLLAAPALFAQAPAVAPEAPMSAGERDQALRLLTESRAALLKATAGLSPEQWKFKAAPDRWSIAECAEHILVVESAVQGGVFAKALAGPREPLRRAEVKLTDAFILQALGDRSFKAKAPERVAPTGRFADHAAWLAAFEANRGLIAGQVKESQADWRARFAPHPFFGTLDAYQWTLLIASHTARHTQQIEEVKRSSGYPASAH